ncbi:MAG TPA: S41 family peptidase [Geothrix sp.]
MNSRSSTVCTALVTFLSFGAGLTGYATVPGMAMTGEPLEGKQAVFDAEFVRNTVETLAGMVEKDYFDPTIGAKVASTLREGLSKGQYANAPDLESLANLLTSDMYAVAKDRHLSLFVTKGLPSKHSQAPTVARESRKERGQHENFGLQKVEVLPGNVGYLRLTGFYQPQEAREAIATSMAFLSHADALIVDLRDHGGGSSQTVALFTSYLLDSPDMPLFEIAHRSQAAPDQYLTESGALPYRNGTRPTFLLTSPRTSSGGEAVAFLLQERHRAEVIGEGTWGGANQVPPPRAVTQTFEALIPNGHTTSALTGKNWEGVGVVPDLPVTAESALRVAHARAIQALLRSAPQGSWHEQLKQELALVERQGGTEPKRH